MKQRLIQAAIIGLICAVVGIWASYEMHQEKNMLGISLATGAIGVVLGLFFKLTNTV